MTAATALLELARPSLARLTAVELRKTVDTRAGRWLLVLIGVAALAMVPVVLFAAPKDERGVPEMFVASQTGVALLLPVLGILSVTSEWSQRTALATFALVPGRGRVLAAKLLGGVALGVAFACAGVLLSFAGRAAGAVLGRSSGSWTMPMSLLGTALLLAAIWVSMGVAFGTLLMNTPLAIVMFFLLPTLWSTLGEMVAKLRGPAGWLDTNKTLIALLDPDVSGGAWARVATSVTVWLAIPLAIGMLRLTRREVK
ncbi:ABC transporter permease [Actinomadura litoris]|uniref:ABC transporter permease n=1 Tax=Actinomadura litoris TaxID=2678616 RepID=A0A7K1L025_9ACTN|nr:ABC transporter permease [Actinomadura litoris]MUN37792.1 ABC transporter permease [Actinomadura litoris]